MTADPQDQAAAAAAATRRIDEMLAALPDDQQAVLQALRRQIAATAPEAHEAISYGMPAFRYHGHPLVSYAAWKDHCSFFPMGPDVLAAHLGELDGFRTAKGTIRFTPDRPVPAHVVSAIVQERMAQIDGD